MSRPRSTARRTRALLVLVSCFAAAACSGEPRTSSAAPVSPPAPQGQSSPAPPPAPRAGDCGPEIEGQADNVRAAVLEALIQQSLRQAAAKGSPHGEIVIGEEQRLPKGQVFVHDASPGVTAHFARHTPPVESYSSAFYIQGTRTERKKERVAFTTGEICWKTGGEAVVKARTIGDDGNTPWSVTVQRAGADWLVKSIDARR